MFILLVAKSTMSTAKTPVVAAPTTKARLYFITSSLAGLNFPLPREREGWEGKNVLVYVFIFIHNIKWAYFLISLSHSACATDFRGEGGMAFGWKRNSWNWNGTPEWKWSLAGPWLIPEGIFLDETRTTPEHDGWNRNCNLRNQDAHH